MAWRRTAAAASVVALLAARPAAMGPTPVRVLAAAAVLSGWVVLVAVAYRRGRGLTAAPPVPGRRTLPAYALIAVGFSLVGVVLVWA
jgi:hypothetical protein